MKMRKRKHQDSMITAEELRALVHYDQDIGVFTRLKRTSNSTNIGDIVGNVNAEGYIEMRVGGKRSYGHRLAFLWMTGSFPEHVVDHINGVKSDNRWCNLRLATRSENQQNLRGAMNNSRSGLLGVSWSKNRQKWQARINVGQVRRHLGYFACQHEAYRAYLKAKAELHPFSTL